MGKEAIVQPPGLEEIKRRSEALGLDVPAILIWGGMGPAATNDLNIHLTNINQEIVGAKEDQDLLPVITISNPNTPDRTKYINALIDRKKTDLLVALKEGNSVLALELMEAEKDNLPENPLPYLLDSYYKASLLGNGKYAGIPCNTAHFFVPVLQDIIRRDGSEIEIVDMIKETVLYIKNNYPEVEEVGILATDGTLGSGLYNGQLEAENYGVIIPSAGDQRVLVMESIYDSTEHKGIKGGELVRSGRNLQLASGRLVENGAQVVIGGCTEIPLVLNNDNIEVPFINPTKVLAEVLVRRTLALRMSNS